MDRPLTLCPTIQFRAYSESDAGTLLLLSDVFLCSIVCVLFFGEVSVCTIAEDVVSPQRLL